MYFTVNLPFIDHLEQLNNTLTILINRNWTNVKQPIPISLDSFQISSKLVHASMMLKDFMEHYHDNRMTISKMRNAIVTCNQTSNALLICDMCCWYFDVKTLNKTCPQCVATIPLVSLLVPIFAQNLLPMQSL